MVIVKHTLLKRVRQYSLVLYDWIGSRAGPNQSPANRVVSIFEVLLVSEKQNNQDWLTSTDRDRILSLPLIPAYA